MADQDGPGWHEVTRLQRVRDRRNEPPPPPLQRLCWQMLLPLQSLQVLLGRLCWQMLAHPQSVHLLLSRLCSQMPAPPQSCTCSSRDYLRTSACPLRSAHSLPLPPSYPLDPRLPLHDRIIGLLPRCVAISPCHDKRSGVPGFTTAFSSSLPTPFDAAPTVFSVNEINVILSSMRNATPLSSVRFSSMPASGLRLVMMMSCICSCSFPHLQIFLLHACRDDLVRRIVGLPK